ncbi:MAG: hypothetical protein SOR67_04965 [Alloprevotella sp.]|nr:hypothetical protein [Alloprevotella sp.]
MTLVADSVTRWLGGVRSSGREPRPLPRGAPRRACIRPSLFLKRVPRFKKQRPACGGVFRGGHTVKATPACGGLNQARIR